MVSENIHNFYFIVYIYHELYGEAKYRVEIRPVKQLDRVFDVPNVPRTGNLRGALGPTV